MGPDHMRTNASLREAVAIAIPRMSVRIVYSDVLENEWTQSDSFAEVVPPEILELIRK